VLEAKIIKPNNQKLNPKNNKKKWYNSTYIQNSYFELSVYQKS
jgi:hypothetical protein